MNPLLFNLTIFIINGVSIYLQRMYDAHSVLKWIPRLFNLTTFIINGVSINLQRRYDAHAVLKLIPRLFNLTTFIINGVSINLHLNHLHKSGMSTHIRCIWCTCLGDVFRLSRVLRMFKCEWYIYTPFLKSLNVPFPLRFFPPLTPSPYSLDEPLKIDPLLNENLSFFTYIIVMFRVTHLL